MSRVSRALREQRDGGCVRLDERRASRAACLSCGLCARGHVAPFPAATG
eukprot:COSAG06_NODE_6211_length_3048_cov_1.984062_4_plen_48_part_01